jgi:hypothetical protein
VMVALKDPGHYIAIVAYNPQTNEVIYNDPWPGNYWPVGLRGTPGFNRAIAASELIANCKPYRVEIG